MPVTSGTRLGSYEIVGLLGAGGMGEVYRARDTKLGREIAIKTLSSALAEDADRLARFEREAKLLAALNHPHIAAVHGLDRHEGTTFLAMELVEGETLEHRLLRGTLTLDEALAIALQIAEALEAAHAKGVVHRDLKPANVMLARDERVKVLDFGLAKAFAGVAGEALPAHSPGLSLAMTQQGLVLGTAAYMAPEQASGQATDQRADIWAFGVVLFEMLTGSPLFSGESVPHILADVLKSEPDWRRLPARLNPRVKVLLERCLSKKLRGRWHSMADVRIELEAIRAAPHGATAETTRPRAARVWQIVALGTGIAMIAAVGGWFARPAAAPEPKPVVRFSIPVSSRWVDSPTGLVAVSADGTRIAYARDRQLYVHELGANEARAVGDTAGGGALLPAAAPAFSPDGQWLAYMSAETDNGPYTLERVPIGGGAPVRVLDAPSVAEYPAGLSWPTPDALLFADHRGIVRLPLDGRPAEVLVALQDQSEHFDSPQLLPGGAVIFTRLAGQRGPVAVDLAGAQVVVQSIGRDDRRVLLERSSAARYLPTGHLVYAQGAALFAVAFDARQRVPTGPAAPMLQGLRRANRFSDTANFAVSDTGTLVMIPAGGIAQAAPIRTTLEWIDENGVPEPLLIQPGDYTAARLSPDGAQLVLVSGAALGRATTTTSLWLYDFATNDLRRLATDPVFPDRPEWEPDGRGILFRGRSPRGTAIYSVDLATGRIREVGAAAAGSFPNVSPVAVVPTQDTLTVIYGSSVDDLNLGTLSLANGELKPLLNGPGSQTDASFSPDGAWFAYQELGTVSEIVIRSFPAVGRTRIPVGTGSSPVISRDGSELFFFDGTGLAAASLTYASATVSVGTPRRLFESNAYLWAQRGRTWDVDSSGRRFVMIRNPPAATTSAPSVEQARIDVVLNWFEELRAQVPIASR